MTDQTPTTETHCFRLTGEVESELLTYDLDDGEHAIGASDECDLLLAATGVSRRHAAMVVADGTLTVRDLGSKNGTFVGDRRIDSPTEVRAGDHLRFGRHSATMQLIVDTSSTWTEMSSVHPGDDTSR